jgi:hypothetical protein
VSARPFLVLCMYCVPLGTWRDAVRRRGRRRRACRSSVDRPPLFLIIIACPVRLVTCMSHVGGQWRQGADSAARLLGTLHAALKTTRRRTHAPSTPAASPCLFSGVASAAVIPRRSPRANPRPPQLPPHPRPNDPATCASSLPSSSTPSRRRASAARGRMPGSLASAASLA